MNAEMIDAEVSATCEFKVAEVNAVCGTRDAETETEAGPEMIDVEVVAVIDNHDAETETDMPPEMIEAVVNAVCEYADAETEMPTLPSMIDAEVHAVCQIQDAVTEMEPLAELKDAEVNAVCETRVAAVNAICEIQDAETLTDEARVMVDVESNIPNVKHAMTDMEVEAEIAFYQSEGLLSSTRDDDGADVLGVDDGSFHTCHQHSPTLLGEDGVDDGFGGELDPRRLPPTQPLGGDIPPPWDQRHQPRQHDLIFSPSPIAAEVGPESQHVATDTDDFHEYLGN